MSKRKKKTIKLPIIIITILALVGIILYLQRPSKPTASYAVNETAALNNNSRLYLNASLTRPATLTPPATFRVIRYYLPSDKQPLAAAVRINHRQYYVRAADLKITMTNPINEYLAQRGYPHAKISQQQLTVFSKQQYQTSSGKPRGVVIHDTGNENSSVASEVAFMKRNYSATRIFVHTFIDAKQIVNIADPKYMAEGAGPKANPYFVQFEMPHEYTKEAFANQLANAAYYTALNLRQNNLPVTKGSRDGTGTVWTHAMVSDYLGGTDHRDPDAYWSRSAQNLWGTSYGINDFITLVQAYYNQIEG